MNLGLNSKMFRAAAVIACAAASAFVHGVDRRLAVPLPQLGFGGAALGIGGGSHPSILGWLGTGAQTTVAVKWEGPDFDASVNLVGLGGANSAAYDSWLDETSLGTVGLVVGMAQDGSGTDNANIWPVTNGTASAAIALPTLGGNSGRAVGVCRCVSPLCSGYLVAGSTQRTNGTVHGTLWHVEVGVPPVAIDLGTLGGANSEATALEGELDSILYIVGRSQTISGAWHACIWQVQMNGDNPTSQIVDRHVFGASSLLTSIDFPAFTARACGSLITEAGHSVAASLDPANLSSQSILGAVGFSDTTADSVEQDIAGSMTFGSAWNGTSAQVPVVWSAVAELGRTATYPLAWMSNVGASEYVCRSANAGLTVGYSAPTSGPTIPIALVADGVQLPDSVSINSGTSETRINEADLWSAADARTILVKPSPRDSTVQMTTRTWGRTMFPTGTYTISFRCRILGPAGVTATAKLELYNFNTNSFDTVGITNDFSDWVTRFFFAPAANHQSTSGELRARITLKPRRTKFESAELGFLAILCGE